MEIHCLFCGESLRGGPSEERWLHHLPCPPQADRTEGSSGPKGQSQVVRWLCGKCGVLFRAGLDPEGCVVRLEVEQCGTPDCCRRAEARGETSSSRSRNRPSSD